MYIKEVNITGFRSYKELTTVRNFSPKHNVVIGRNGSGKSNFFTAIQFVLSNEFSRLTEQERHALLHESIGNRSVVAKVELVIDNADRRIPTDTDEVRILRQVGQKKDQYMIDNKVVNRNEVVNLMESAGFSRSNPYYIVKQGKIMELATASDAYRLKLIKEVAGTRVFDEKKEESNTILLETQTKIEKSQTLLGFINERLQKLEEEKEDLAEYQKLDKMRRAIECTIYEMETGEAKMKNEELALKREKINQKQNEVETNLLQAKMAIQDVEKELRKTNNHCKGIMEERETLLNEQSELMERKTQLELAIKDLSEDVMQERSGKKSAEEEYGQLVKEISKREEELDRLQPDYQNLVQQESQLNTDIRIAEQRCKELYTKQGYVDQFKTVEERDKHLKRELKKFDFRIEDTQKQITEIKASISKEEGDKEQLMQQYQQVKRELEAKSTEINSKTRLMKEKKAEMNKAISERMDFGRMEKEHRERLEMVKYETEKMEQEMRRLTSKGIVNGIASVKTVLEDFREESDNLDIVDGYYGLVIDLFGCQNHYNKAIEVTADSRLFYHVVQDDRVAMRILERINKLKLSGEVNFYPLNRIITRERRNVQDEDARPLLDFMEYDLKFEQVLCSIFANTVLVRDLAVGTRVARNERFDCVTLDGDQVSRRGPMTGGYMDVKKSRLDLARRLKNANGELLKLEGHLAEWASKVELSLRNVDKIRLEIGKMELEIQELSREHHIITDKKKALAEQLNQLSTLNLTPKKSQIVKLEARIREIEAHKNLLNAQLGTDLPSQMSIQERENIDQLENDIRERKTQLEILTKSRLDVENKIQTLKNELQQKLLKKRENLNAKIDSITVEEKSNLLDTEQAEVKLVNQRLNGLVDRLKLLEEELEKIDGEKEALAKHLDSHQEVQREFNEQLEMLAKDAEIYCTKIANLQAKREECTKKMTEIGSVPSDVHGKYDKMNLKQLDKKLTECMNELKKYDNVNKKALDQFMRATQQKEELSERVKELQKNEQAIQDLLTVLDNRRYETLHLTFKQVAKNFTDVFKKLIPQGTANLVMQTVEKTASGFTSTSRDTTETNGDLVSVAMDSSNTSGTSQQQQQKQLMHELETFVGTSIKVSFTGTSETRDITSLSGGQKTLVALALIFAIQKCDPAPFYLFDEIDAALDQEHRRAVAGMIHELSQNAQFITTTFRAELLEHAEKFFGVRVRDKVSYIDEISREKAVDFVQDDQTHG